MTPQEIADYKLKWMPGASIRLHSDLVDLGKTWCKRNVDKQSWSVSTWTAPYEHTFYFEDVNASKAFAEVFEEYVYGDNV